MANAAIILLDLAPLEAGSLAPADVPRAIPARRLVDSPWALAPIVLAIATSAASDAHAASRSRVDTNQPWTAAPIVPVFTPGAWLDLQSAATGQSSIKARRGEIRPDESAWTQPPLPGSAAPFAVSSAERATYRSPQQIPEPWILPPLAASASPWEEAENPERSTWNKPRQPDEVWSQSPIKLTRWDADGPERSTYRRAKQPDFEGWTSPPFVASPSPWEESENPERTAYAKPRGLDEPWTSAPLVTSASPWEETEDPERPGYARPRQPDEPWAFIPVEESASPWELSENPERSTYTKPRLPDEPWSARPVALSRDDADRPAVTGYRKPRPIDEPWALAPVEASESPWGETEDPERAVYSRPQWHEQEPWSARPLAGSAAPWATQDPRPAPVPRQLPVEPWTLRPIALPRQDADAPTASTYRRPRQPDEPWAQPAVALALADANQVERKPRLIHQPDVEGWQHRPALFQLSPAPWAVQEITPRKVIPGASPIAYLPPTFVPPPPIPFNEKTLEQLLAERLSGGTPMPPFAIAIIDPAIPADVARLQGGLAGSPVVSVDALITADDVLAGRVVKSVGVRSPTTELNQATADAINRLLRRGGG